ncbi:MAG: recombinase RecT [Oscillospiraceae bacterium]
MSQSNALQKPKFSVAIQTDMYRNLINNTLQDAKRASRFIASISSAVATNPALQECDAGTILSSALLGEALNLSPSPQLGQYYLVPYNDKKRDCKVAQFQLGAKGYKQLAIRSGQYLDIDCIEIKQGEFMGRDKYNGKQRFEFIEDDAARENLPTIGYLAYFELLNGFKKQIYWTVEKMENHANTYSQAFNLNTFHKIKNGEIPQSDMWKYSSFWYKSFAEMAEKTMLRQLISKWGIMSIEMQDAITKDMAVIDKDGNTTYVDVDSVDEQEPIEHDKPLHTSENDVPDAVNIDDL